MTNLAQYLSVFLREYLPLERRASMHTCETYAYTFQLLVNFAARQLKLSPSKLTIEQLNVTPITKTQFIISKLLPFWFIGLFVFAFGLVVGKLIFQFPVLGSITLLFAFTGLYLTAVLGIGLFISTVTNTQQQAMLIAWFFLVIFILMSGLFNAIENMPSWAQKIAWFNPVSYFVEFIRLVLLKGSEFRHVIRHFVVIGVMSLVINTLAILTYNKRS